MIDTGADISVMSGGAARRVAAGKFEERDEREPILRAANAAAMKTDGSARVAFEMAGTTWEHEFAVCGELSRDFVLGSDFLTKHGARILCDQGRVTFLRGTYAEELERAPGQGESTGIERSTEIGEGLWGKEGPRAISRRRWRRSATAD